MVEQIKKNLYQIIIPLPGNPLRTLNSYVITSDERNLIIDTGFNMPECLVALEAGIAELGLDMTKTDILATHLHSDHIGLIAKVMSESTEVLMGRVDSEILEKALTPGTSYWDIAEQKFIVEGYPKDEMARTKQANPGRKYAPSGNFKRTTLEEGDRVAYGDFVFDVILTPGHTPGHICLYDQAQKLFISADHLLFDITPNISWWHELEDGFGSYLDSLQKIAPLDVELTLTGHRKNEGNFRQRIVELQQHHDARLQDVLDIVRASPGVSGYDIAARMPWSITTTWEDFPPGQRWFAVGEAITHIEHLVKLGKLTRTVESGVHVYRV